MSKVTVIATAAGFDGVTIRKEGDEFQMDESVFKPRPKLDAQGKPTGENHPAPSWFKRKEGKAAPAAAEESEDLA